MQPAWESGQFQEGDILIGAGGQALSGLTLRQVNLANLKFRYRPRTFNRVRHQTTSACIENKHFFTKSRHHQTYQNYEQPPQSLKNLYFQSHLSASKIN